MQKCSTLPTKHGKHNYYSTSTMIIFGLIMFKMCNCELFHVIKAKTNNKIILLSFVGWHNLLRFLQDSHNGTL